MCLRLPSRLHVAGAVSLGVWAWLAWVSRQPGAGDVWRVLAAQAVAWLVLGVAWRAGLSPGSILGWAVAFRLCGLVAAPLLDDDFWRFLWDGRQLVLTGNPYALPPSAFFADESLSERWRDVLDQVNYPHVPTIYGPVNQAAFGLSHWIAPGALWPWKVILLLAEAAGWRAVCRVSANFKVQNASRALLLVAWCPLAVFETGFNAHPDALGIALLLGALAVGTIRTESRVTWLAGPALLALAVAAKVFALLLVPFVLRGRSWQGWAVFVITLAAAYAPFWLRGSAADLAGLQAFAGEWEFNSAVFGLAQWLAGTVTAKIVCGAMFIAGWLALGWRWWRGQGPSATDWPPGELVYGLFLLLSATINPWYLLWLLPFVALRPTATGVTALAAVSLSHLTGLNLGRADLDSFAHPGWVRGMEFGLIALAFVWDCWGQQRGRNQPREPVVQE